MINAESISKLLESDIFRGVSAASLERFFRKTQTVNRKYPAEKLLMLRGEVVDSLMILVEGRLQAQIQGKGGKLLRIEVLKAPQAVAAGVLFSQDNRLPVNLFSLESSKIIFIPKKAVLELCAAEQVFMLNYFTDMGDKISILAEKIKMYQFNTIRQKISGYIIGLSGAMKLKSVKLVYSKEVLAEIMGVTRPSLSRELSNLSASGIIKVSGKTIDILDRPALESLLSEEE
ncbi:MAG: Crp/Fnr family transcriptional regulator [Spirochaetales bacterium]|uniref:Crp/Fnr family transcriptional regulator n=1 Tax=Candidatus Thalassospirochaeta sargassi TaxID=3119039 RepID=A0AAJ1MN46_9SPIO|nr:Crp/Fnr family transcriptional regulator [Spirochaetales bacterium]